MAWKGDFSQLTKKTHTEQGIWWLNGFWNEGASGYAETIWTIVHHFIETQTGAKVLYGSKQNEVKEDSDLDEFKSHRILEVLGETLTVVALRKRLQALDLDSNKRMAITEYLLDKYKKTPQQVVDAPQGDVDPELLAQAQAACDRAAAALEEAAKDAEAAGVAQKKAEDALAVAAAAEAEVRAAEAELQAAIDEITALEKSKSDKVAACQKIIDDPATGAVKKGKAVQEKEQILAEDPLPLRKAKITQGAALKRVTKAREVAEAETQKSADAAAAAAAAKAEADASERAAEQALKDAQQSLEDLKKKGGTPMGRLWWMERTLKEKQKYAARR